MRNKINNGFTLIEVLIAMTLLSIMVVLLFASLQICADSWHKGENKIANVNEVTVVYQFFQHHLATAQPLLNEARKKTGDVSAPLAFQGKNQSLQFVSALPASAARLGLQLFVIEKKKEEIKVTISPFFPAKNGLQPSKEEVILLTGVSDFSIRYFGSNDALDNNNTLNPASWHDEWLEKISQPRLIKITIKLNNGSFWPEMLIPLKITATQNQDLQSQSTVTQ